LANTCKERSKFVINSGFVPESVRLFGFGMEYADILRVVELEANNPSSLGRGYTCGVSNVGLVKFPSLSEQTRLKVTRSFYGTSHSRNGVFCQLSCSSILDKEQNKDNYSTFCGCLQLTEPLISRNEAILLRGKLVKFLGKLARAN
jgi:hypothetical protein